MFNLPGRLGSVSSVNSIKYIVLYYLGFGENEKPQKVNLGFGEFGEIDLFNLSLSLELG